jgi:hypothetical protein
VIDLAGWLEQQDRLSVVLRLGHFGDVGEVELQEAGEGLRVLQELRVLLSCDALGGVALDAASGYDLSPDLLFIELAVAEALIRTTTT